MIGTKRIVVTVGKLAHTGHLRQTDPKLCKPGAESQSKSPDVTNFRVRHKWVWPKGAQNSGWL